MTSKELTEQGVAALKEGDKSRAHDLLQQAVELDPDNAKAWFFLSRTQTSTAEQRASLQKVLDIMPNNKPAQEALEKLSLQEEDFSEFEDEEEPVASGYTPPTSMGVGTGTKPKIGGIQIPVAIPDAPEQVEPKTIIDEFVATFKNGIEILRRTPGIYPKEIQKASWWHFWQFVVVAWIISGIASAIAGAVSQAQLASMYSEFSSIGVNVQPPSIFVVILTAILSIPLGIIVLYAGLYASHRFVTSNRDGQGSFVAHCYTIMVPVVTASLISNVASLLLSFIPFLGALVSLALVVLWLYSMWIAGQGVAIVHKVTNSTGYWTMAVLVLVQIVTSIIIGIVLSPIILTTGLGFI